MKKTVRNGFSVCLLALLFLSALMGAASAGIPGDTDEDRCVTESEFSEVMIPYMKATFIGEETPHLDQDELQSAAHACIHQTWIVTDDLGRRVEVPTSPEHLICSHAGTLRYLTYLEAQGMIVGVDSIEKGGTPFDTRPYALAHPEFREKPVFGEFRGFDDPEKIVALDPQPQLIFKTYVPQISDADELQQKTGIPVVCLNYGNLGAYRDVMYHDLRLMGEIVDKEERAENVIDFFDAGIEDLNDRTEDVPDSEKKSVYIGGIAFKGPRGLQSTEPAYPPFMFVNAKNVAAEVGNEYANVGKDQIVKWDPEILFIDLGTMQGGENSAIYQLKNDPAYGTLQVLNTSEIYGVLPYNWYTTNHGSVLVDAYYVGKVLYPDRFDDIDPAEKADDIYEFLVGKKVFDLMNPSFDGKAFTRLTL